MKLGLIVPALPGATRNSRKTLCPPLAPAAVAALTPPDVEVSITDENVTAIDFNTDADLIGITALTSTAKRAYEIADIFRAGGKKVILGGIHPSILPAEAVEHADSVIIGEAEGLWPALIEDFRSGRLQKIYRQDKHPDLAGLPSPRRELFARDAYFIPNTISTSRGCPYACSFCSVTLFFGNTYRCRPVAEIVKEIESLDLSKPFIFVDDNIAGKPVFAKELFRAIIPLKITWIGQASVTVANDDELLGLAAASGCAGLLIGFESINPVNLAGVGKKINKADKFEEVIKKVHAHGIAIHGCFIFGLDEDDERVFKRTVRFAQAMRLETAQFSFAMPHPGTALFALLEKEDRILSKDWSRYNDDIVYEPKLMSGKTLQAGHDWASPEFYSLPSILRRLGIIHRHPAALWFTNLFFRSHWKRKLNGRAQKPKSIDLPVIDRQVQAPGVR